MYQVPDYLEKDDVHDGTRVNAAFCYNSVTVW